jgi:hypothetical protein
MGIKNFTALYKPMDITTFSLSRIRVTTLNNFLPFNQIIKNILNDTDVKENCLQNSTFTLSNDKVKEKIHSQCCYGIFLQTTFVGFKNHMAF